MNLARFVAPLVLAAMAVVPAGARAADPSKVLRYAFPYLKSNLADQFVVKNIEAGSSKRQNTNQGTLNLMEGDTLTSGKYFIIFPNRTLFQYYPSFQKLKQNVTSPVTLITTTYQSPLINQD